MLSISIYHGIFWSVPCAVYIHTYTRTRTHTYTHTNVCKMARREIDNKRISVGYTRIWVRKFIGPVVPLTQNAWLISLPHFNIYLERVDVLEDNKPFSMRFLNNNHQETSLKRVCYKYYAIIMTVVNSLSLLFV